MKYITALILLIFLSNCNNSKTVLICGDHVCVNKDEAEQYFEENLTLEVKVINKKEKKEIDLIELNLKENKNDNKKITLYAKKNTKKDLKILNNDEISKIKENVKNNKRLKKIKKEKIKKKDTNSKIAKKNINKTLKISNAHVKKKVVDICSILEECSIDEISKYLLKQGKKKFPDITKRQ